MNAIYAHLLATPWFRWRPLMRAAFVAGVAAFLASLAPAAEIRFRRQSTTARAIIRLGDVAEIVDAEPHEIESLRNLELFPAPSIGSVREVRTREVRELLTLQGIDPTRVRFTGESVVRVRATQEISELSATRANSAAVAKASASSPVAEKGEPSPGEALVLTMVRAVRRGEILKADDMVLKAAPSTGRKEAWLVNTDDVVGRETLKSFNAGERLLASSLRLPLLVQKGEIVSVVVRGGGVTVRTTAQALQDGARGEVVAVQSSLSRKEQYSARVIDDRTVEVLAHATSVPAPNLQR